MRALSVRLLVIVILAGASIGAALPSQAAVPAPTAKRFDVRHAWAELLREVSYGPRPAGSAALRRLAVTLRARLPHGRFEPFGHAGLRNIVGYLPGRLPAIAVVAHYDVSDVPGTAPQGGNGYLGANDGAGGAAAVIELARAMSLIHRPPGAPELRFVLFDGEEPVPSAPPEQFYRYGDRGSKAYAAAHARELRALILLDFIANRNLRIPRELGSDTTLWAALRRAAAEVGESAVFPPETFSQVLDDHTPFTQLGVTAIDLIDFNYPCHDRRCDVPGNLSMRSLDAAGETVLQLLVDLSRA